MSLTTTEQVPRKKDSAEIDMGDSGFFGSLRLSLQESSSSTLSISGTDAYQSASKARRNSKICYDFDQMNLSSDKTFASQAEHTQKKVDERKHIKEEAWKEYFEPDEDGDVQLHLAIASGFVDVINALIRIAPHPDYLSIQNNASYAPLHIAVLQNQPAIVRQLVVSGAQVDVRDREGNTPLHMAARRGYFKCGEALLKPIAVDEGCALPYSASSSLISVSLILNMFNHNGESCVHLAAMGGHATFLHLLCWNGSDMNAVDGRGGRTALHFAVGARNVKAIQCLIEPQSSGGCGVNVNQIDWYGRTPYQLALMNNTPELAHFLASFDVGCDTTPFRELTPEESEEDWRSSHFLLDSSA